MTEKLLKQIITLYENSSALEMEVTVKDLSVKLKRQTAIDAPKTMKLEDKNIILTEDISSEEINKNTLSIKSPLVGIYYEAKSPGEAPFIKVGDHVSKGQVLAIVEAMKIMNHITAPEDGIVSNIHVNNGALIEFDQTMIEIITGGE